MKRARRDSVREGSSSSGVGLGTAGSLDRRASWSEVSVLWNEGWLPLVEGEGEEALLDGFEDEPGGGSGSVEYFLKRSTSNGAHGRDRIASVRRVGP